MKLNNNQHILSLIYGRLSNLKKWFYLNKMKKKLCLNISKNIMMMMAFLHKVSNSQIMEPKLIFYSPSHLWATSSTITNSSSSMRPSSGKLKTVRMKFNCFHKEIHSQIDLRMKSGTFYFRMTAAIMTSIMMMVRVMIKRRLQKHIMIIIDDLILCFIS